MSDDYYKHMLGEIEQLIDEDKIEVAYKRLREELEMPYIPKNVELDIINLFKRVNALRNERKPQNNAHIWSLEQIETMINDPFDEEIHLVAFEHLKTMNVRMILPTLRKYLMNSLYRNENKSYLLFLLKHQGLDENFQVKKTNGIFTINPLKLANFNDNKQVQAVCAMLEDFVYINDPSLYNICLMVLENYFYAMCPQFINENEIKSLTAAIMFKAHVLQSNPVDLLTIANLLECDEKSAQVFLESMENNQVV